MPEPVGSGRVEAIQELVEGALALESEKERSDFLDRECDDPDTRARVEAMLASEDVAAGFFDSLAGSLRLNQPPIEPDVDLSGRTVGAYRLIEPLGRGGMGVVYLAERSDGEFEHRVAVKLLAMGVSTANARQRFLAERQILAGLEHPAIARLLDGGVAEDGTPYFVMELVEGERIDRWCDKRQLPVGERLRLMIAVGEAVEAAHRRLIVHRDLKPSNVLVTEDAQTEQGQPKLLDFGVAKVLAGADGELTQSRFAPLTPSWAAPEQVAGDAVTTATDTYALGALAYKLLTGTPPHLFEQRTPTVMLAELASEAQPPSRRFESLPADEQADHATARGTTAASLSRALEGDLDAVLGKALDPDPERRYGSAGELAEDLRNHLAARPVGARPPSRAYRFSRFVARHRAAVAGAATVALVGLIGLATTVWQAREAGLEAERAGQQAARATAALEYTSGLLEDLVPDAGEPVIERSMILSNAADDAAEALAEQPLALADIQSTLAALSERVGDYSRALELRRSALTLRREYLGEDHLETAEALGKWATTRAQTGDPERAKVVDAYERAIASMERHRDESPRHADLRLAYASYLGEQDEMSAALGHLRVAETLLGASADHHRQQLDIRGRTGAVLLRMERVNEAEALLRTAVDEARRTLDQPDRVTAGLLTELSKALGRRHEFDEAIVHAEEAVDAYERLFPEGNERTLDGLSVYATTLMAAGRHQQAIEVRGRHLDLTRQIFGEQHHQVALALSELGTLRFRQGNFSGAASMQRESARVFEHLYGADHAAVAIVRGNLGDALFELNRHREAKAEWQAVLPTLCATFGNTSSRCASRHNSLGRVELQLDRPTVAEDHFRAALAGHRQTVGDEHPNVAATRAWLAESLRLQGRIDEAVVELDKAVALVPADTPDRHHHFMVIAPLRARLTCQIEEPEACRDMVRVADGALAETYSQDHPRRQSLRRLVAQH